MNVSIANNGWINGRVVSARWVEMGPDSIVTAVGTMVLQVPLKLTGGTEVSVEAPDGIVLRVDNAEFRIEANVTLKLASDGRITLRAPGVDNTFSITAWKFELDEPDSEGEGAES